MSHVHLSPILETAEGSSSGYEVADPTRVASALGGESGFDRFARRAAELGLGLILDIVPNHMSTRGRRNRWWWDVLENGPASRHAGVFDIEWEPPESRLRDRVLLPVLDDHYGRVLARGGIRVVRDVGAFEVRYGESAFPVAPRSLDDLLRDAARRTGSAELAFIADAHAALPLATEAWREASERRHRDKQVLRSLLVRLLQREPALGRALDATLAAWNADAEKLHALLERQNYRLAWWRASARDLGHRRFFDVSELIGVRVEDPEVFDETHARVLEWVASARIQGLRIDHIDGLREPAAYLERLRRATPRAPELWIGVEKILAPDERLRADWRADGTTGYDFLRIVTGLFIEPAAEKTFDSLQLEATGDARRFEERARECKARVLRDLLGSELNRLTALWVDVCEENLHHRDHVRHALHEALHALIVAFPVYRSYVDAAAARVDPADCDVVREAVALARGTRPDLDPELFDLLESLLTLQTNGPRARELVMRFQQVTGAAMAKGVEDTAFYADARLLANQEVGCDPARFAVAPAEAHAFFLSAAECGRIGMLCSTTHDTKRSEDTRVRIACLSELADRFADQVREWRRRHAPLRGPRGPDAALELFLYQTLIGVWPIEPERLRAYLEKAAREAKTGTSWLAPDATFEAETLAFAEALLADARFVSELEAWVAELDEPARAASLAQTLVRCTAPGFPDVYQGSELWDHRLVDPDNRGPVDFATRAALLQRAADVPLAALWRRERASGLPKLALLRAALAARRARPECFAPGASYRPLAVTGREARRAFAFLRGEGAATVVPRLCVGAPDGFPDTALELPAGVWRDALGGLRVASRGSVPLRLVLRDFPGALLLREAT